MSGPFFSQSWFRVAKRRPKLAHHLKVQRHRYRGGAWYVLEDPATGKVHRLSPAAYIFAGRLDGLRTVEEAWLDLVELQGEDAPTQDEIIQLLGQLHGADLLSGDVAANIVELDERNRKQARAYLKQSLMNPTSLRVPLWNPDRFLDATAIVGRLAFSWGGLAAFVVLVGYALVLAGENWGALTENLSDRVLSFDNLLIMALVYPLVKGVHELAHGYAAKVHGATVPEMGLMFLVFFPVPYVDASGSAAFRDKGKRVLVAGAGILAEVTLAAIAMILWVRVGPGFERALLFNVMLIGGVSTVLVNGNPLLKFDGYFIFADLIEIPNLAQRANRYLQHLLETRGFGATGGTPPLATPGEKAVFLAYAPAAYVYRLFLMAGIAYFVATRYLAIGVLLALWMVTQTLLWPAFKGLRHVFGSARLQRKRGRAVGVTLGAIAVLAGFLGLVPLPSTHVGQGVIWLPTEAFVRAGADGFVETIGVRPGVEVTRGTIVAQLAEPTAEAKLRTVEWRVRELELKLAAATLDPFLKQTVEIDLTSAREEMARERERERRRTALAGSDGRVLLATLDRDMPGRYFSEGDALGYVLPETASEIRAVAPAHLADRLRARLQGVEIYVPGTGETASTLVLREVPQASFALPSPAFAQSAGGDIATDPRDGKNMTALSRFVVFDLSLPETMRRQPFGKRVLVKYRFAPEPAATQIYRYARRLILRDFDA